MLSTYHDDSMVTKSRRSHAAVGGTEDIEKPRVVEDYNRNMCGVDKSKFQLVKHLFIACIICNVGSTGAAEMFCSHVACIYHHNIIVVL